jgi:DNA topoisomerase II
MDTDSDVYAISDANASDSAFTPPAAKKKKMVNGAAKATATTKKTGAAAAPKKKPLAPRRSNSAIASDDDDDFDPKPSAPAAKAGSSKTKTATETYQKLTQLEHILKRPDTYIGSIEKQSADLWVFDKNTKMMTFRKTEYVPGFYKIFDEILVNAADNKVGLVPHENRLRQRG